MERNVTKFSLPSITGNPSPNLVRLPSITGRISTFLFNTPHKNLVIEPVSTGSITKFLNLVTLPVVKLNPLLKLGN